MAAEYCPMQGMVPGTVVLTFEPCPAFLRTSSSSYRMGVPGRMALVDSECADRRRAVSRVPTSPSWRDTGSESEVWNEMRVWMYEMTYKEIEGSVLLTLMA